MKIGALSWNGNNIGDDIQSVAVMQHLPSVDACRFGVEAYLSLRNTPTVEAWAERDHSIRILYGCFQ